ncbi:PREDICTED: Fc receptor-like protein 3 isoform X2 [Ceratotherium simum simum]|uniref:Fc receptor-like protein 3 isoform X2 n=1 Tax=Ceratotherium simum simum TaxID=73337 RepID=A0ABM1D6S5_CERSS|nr:PREDICTED: Fc receptor-like protein 3 isoform X2 [Ceratotherium simum simum]
MLLWLLLLILAPGREQSGLAPKAFLLLTPSWTTNFKGEKVTLTCWDSHSPAKGDIYWYYNDNFWKKESGDLQINMSGYYKCKTQRSSFSDPVHVEFLSDWLILQASHPVFEGDNITLRCRGKKEADIREKIYYKDGEKLVVSYDSGSVRLNSISRISGKYHCTASGGGFWRRWEQTSKPLRIQVQELFPPPLLTASSSQPIEGNPVTLKCETWLPPQKSYIQLQFCFFREDKVLGSGWSSSPELQIPAIWSEDSRSYWCQAGTVTHSVMKRSLKSQIHVQRVPVSDVNIEMQPPGGQLIEGENLVLICSAAKGTGTITFSWHREGIIRSLGRKTQRSLSAELWIPTVKESDAGRYYCAADNFQGPILSEWITVTLRIPVSRPVLTVNPAGAQPVVGELLELHCEAQRGSPPILYWFYHDNDTLGNSLAPFGGGASFNLSLMAQHSGNYSCGADNGLGVQCSEMVTLNFTGSSRNKIILITVGVIGGLLSILGLAATAALMGNFKTQRKSGGLSATGTPSYSPNECQEPSSSRPFRIDPQEPTYSEPPALMELQPVYSNVNPGDSELVYSQIWSIQHTKENLASAPRMHWEHKGPTVIYSELKKAHPDDSAVQASSRGSTHGDATENYENVPCASSALDH